MVDEKYYSGVFQALPVPCLVLLPDAPIFTIVNANDAYLRLTDARREELIGKGYFDVYPTNPYQSDIEWSNIFDEVLRKKHPDNIKLQKFVTSHVEMPENINVRYLEVVNTPVMDEQGEITLIIRSITDVTEAVTHEKLLEETQQVARLGSWDVNLVNETVTWSEGLKAIYEVGPDYQPDVESSLSFYSNDQARQDSINAFSEVMKKDTVFRMTLPITTAKGNHRWFSIVGKADVINGRCVRVYGISKDVTETKFLAELDKLEKRILELNAKRDTPIKFILSEYLGGIERLFPGLYCSIHGVQHDRLRSWVAPSLPESYLKAIHNKPIGLNNGSCGTAAYLKAPVIVSDIANDPRWADYKHLPLAHDLKACWSYPIFDGNANVIAVLGMYYKQVKAPDKNELAFVDRMSALLQMMLENRQNADLAQETTAMMSQAQELAHFGYWQWNFETSKGSWSDELYAIYGLKKTDSNPTFERYLSQVHQDDQALVTDLLNQVRQTGKDTVFEERIVRPTGEVRYLRSWVRLVTGDDGAPVKLIGASLDITDMKLSELKLKTLHGQLAEQLKEVEKSEKRYSDLFHLSPQPMWVYDVETYRFLDVNSAAISHYGYTREEFLSMTIKDIRPSEEAPKLEAAVTLSRQHDELFTRGIYIHRKKNGKRIDVEVQSNIITFHGRRAEVILIHDITEKLQYIQAIETQNQKLQEIAWMQSHLVRAPLARIMGLIDLIQNFPESGIKDSELLAAINNSAIELDDILRNITDKAEQINPL
ncbi:PAS domain S-box protein [Parapedobacter sp. DT-150]|uniref:PAS domain S-box protein n=1 Tax=Parapedobacter sp. DT-150 TaxID=3396162 RepID=UPI003F1C96D2